MILFHHRYLYRSSICWWFYVWIIYGLSNEFVHCAGNKCRMIGVEMNGVDNENEWSSATNHCQIVTGWSTCTFCKVIYEATVGIIQSCLLG